MSITLTRTRKCAARDLALFIDANRLRPDWLENVREVVGLTQYEMAAAVGMSRRQYQEWEADARLVPGDIVHALKAYLAESGVDSRGRMLAAKAVG